MSSTINPSSTSTSSSSTATSSDVNQLYVPSSVISIGIGFVGFAAAFVICGFFLRVMFVRRTARARGETLPTLGDIFFASLGGTGLRGSERMHMYMNPDAPWLRRKDEADVGPKPEIWDVRVDEKEGRGEEGGEGVVGVTEWKPLSIQPLTIYPSRRSNPFRTKSTPTASAPPSGTTTPATTVHLISVSLLIAMPTPTPSPPRSPDNEDAVPDMCFGLTEMVAVDATSTSTSTATLERASSSAEGRIRDGGKRVDKTPEVEHVENVI